MSRSQRAWTEQPTSVRAVRGTGEWPGCEDERCLASRTALGAVRSTKCLVIWTAAIAFIMGAAPAIGLAASASGSDATALNTHHEQQPNRGHSAAAVALNLGSGYSSRSDAARVRA